MTSQLCSLKIQTKNFRGKNLGKEPEFVPTQPKMILQENIPFHLSASQFFATTCIGTLLKKQKEYMISRNTTKWFPLPKPILRALCSFSAIQTNCMLRKVCRRLRLCKLMRIVNIVPKPHVISTGERWTLRYGTNPIIRVSGDHRPMQRILPI